MTQADLIAALPEGRLPPGLMALRPSDLLALFGAGLIVSALLSLLILPFTTRRPSRKTLIRATRDLPPEDRLLAIARILGHLPEELRPAAYGLEPPPSGEALERIALSAKRPVSAESSSGADGDRGRDG
ncbi:hypothetical protein [Roseibium aggregatum]|uniref:Uncharacterized protein n=1 Tax=Roseibium aggregatum TaxID=187304 RepID=A0A939J590_9HYPH|nr:hypothetical protein [Roseibium aggregatum]MBN9671489.1 hypothetical protein [Roseibium aggregatum]